ncbi:hypothetical protein Vi05172_g1352 [Venturia inaequalis]|uniref:F-box domain-containing protein n=1 Tax=Venturia inaequalis TaxID=5025 RepID=A0A8H3VQD1_VENIN|nr:hypothetical protein EG327_004933 [Venturia inaequalis]RDI88933.1 hypothetical protein Vi05172_g1352 [Venturia inaequalis]
MANPVLTGGGVSREGRGKNHLFHFGKNKISAVEPIIHDPDPVDNSNSPLLNLPGELRSLIWKYAFTLSTEERLRVAQYFPKRRDAFALILTCKQISQEIGRLPYLNAVFVIWPGAHLSHGSQQGWVDLPEGYVVKWTNALPAALQTHPDTVKCLAIGFSLFSDEYTNPLDSLIDSETLRNAGINPEEFVIKLCTFGSPAQESRRIMSFCISLERLAMQFPTLNKMIIYYCSKCAHAHLPGRVTNTHIIRSSSGTSWDIRPVKGSDGNTVEMKWVTSPHPGQALQAISWTSRMVRIEYFDSLSVSGVQCLREPAKVDVKKDLKSIDGLAHEDSEPQTTTKSRLCSAIKGRLGLSKPRR